MVEFELKRAGTKLENKFNRDVMQTLIDGRYTTNDVTATVVKPAHVAHAVGNVKKQNWHPDTMIIHAIPEYHLVSGSALMHYQLAGDNMALRKGEIGTLIGLAAKRLTTNSDTSKTNKWGCGYDASNEIGVAIFDSTAFGLIGMRRDVTVEQYNDPIHDLKGISATMRYGSTVVQKKAGAFIKYS